MKKRERTIVLWKLLQLVKPLLPKMVLAVLAGSLGHFCAIFLPVTAAGALFHVKETGFVWSTLAILLLGMALLRGILHYVEQNANHDLAFRLLAVIREKVFSALRRLAPAKLEGRQKGDLLQVLTADIELLEVFYAHTISPMAIAVCVNGGMVLYLWSRHWLFGLYGAVAYLGIGFFWPRLIADKGKTLGRDFRKESGALSGYVLENLRGLQETQQYQYGEVRKAGMLKRIRHMIGLEKEMKEKRALAEGVTGALLALASLGSVALMAVLVENGSLSMENGLTAAVAFMSAYGPVVALAALGSTLQQTIAAGERVLQVLEEEPMVEENLTGTDPLDRGKTFEGAKVDQVEFSYGERQVLSGASLDISAGQITGLIGPSGSGKSTLLKLLMRFWDPEKGKIEISGVPVAQIRTTALRSMEGYMTQDTFLFHESIADNLRIARPLATDKELEIACRKASIHSFIQSLPQGYETLVGELGDTLSGGERQRLGLARAFLQNAPLLLLDEPTSNLDSLNEAVILQSLDLERQDRTIVLVSHRASTMGIADRVFHVNQGRIS